MKAILIYDDIAEDIKTAANECGESEAEIVAILCEYLEEVMETYRSK